jgi:hypothetical protein
VYSIKTGCVSFMWEHTHPTEKQHLYPAYRHLISSMTTEMTNTTITPSEPEKVAISVSQKTITSGRSETDLDLLSLEAGRPVLLRVPSSSTSDDEFTTPGKQRRHLFCQIAVSYAALTLYSLPPPSCHGLILGG